jgi:hypothetical protein
MLQGEPALPPPILPANQSRVAYNNRTEVSPHSRSTTDGPRGSSSNRGRGVSLGPSTSRGRYSEADREEWSRERSESREGRTGSRVPLFRRGGNGEDKKENDVEKSAGRDWEGAEEEKMRLQAKSSEPSWLKNLGRHFIGVRDKQ